MVGIIISEQSYERMKEGINEFLSKCKLISFVRTLTVTAPAMIPSTVDSAKGSNVLSGLLMKLGFSKYLFG